MDQLTAIEEVKADMEKPIPMGPVICGDVARKTSRSRCGRFKAVQDGKQVAVLVPTTLLADQHLQTFGERMSGFPVTIMVCRFTDAAESLRRSTAWPTADYRDRHSSAAADQKCFWLTWAW